MKVSFSGIGAHYRRLQYPIDAAVRNFLESGWYVGGPLLDSFEQMFADFTGAAFAVGVANGTDAIALALRACGVQRDDEVIVPAFSAYPTTVGVVQAGAIPIFVDVLLEEGLLDPSLIAAAITPRTRAIVPVHLYGSPCDMRAISAEAERHGLWVVEDCAQAHGARACGRSVGSFSSAAAWSFYPTKNLGAMGDAGAVTTSDSHLAQRLRRLRNYGQASRYEHVEVGINSRLDPLQAAILRVKLPHLESDNEKRRVIAAFYDEALADHGTVQPLQRGKGGLSSNHLYVVRCAQRALLQEHLSAAGVETLIHYPISMPTQEASDPAWGRCGPFPAAESLCNSVLSLPLYPDLKIDEGRHVVESIKGFGAAR